MAILDGYRGGALLGNVPGGRSVQPPAAVSATPRRAWRKGRFELGERTLPEETPVALVHDGSTTAVMMASPTDLADLAYGFALTEGLIAGLEDVARAEVVTGRTGVEARLWLVRASADALQQRRRTLAGPTGCGLCGVDSLEQAVRPPRPVGDSELRIAPKAVLTAMAAIEPLQKLGEETRAVHAAAFWTPDEGVVAIREDVGRHNALDKLAGVLLRKGRTAAGGAVLLTSRVSVEMVQKAAAIGAPVIVAVSAPTALAVRTAEWAGITLAAVARADGFEVFTRSERIVA